MAVFCLWYGIFEWGRLYDNFSWFVTEYGRRDEGMRIKYTSYLLFLIDIVLRLSLIYYSFDLFSNFTLGLSIFGIKEIMCWRMVKSSHSGKMKHWQPRDFRTQKITTVFVLMPLILGKVLKIDGMVNEGIMFTVVYFVL